MVRKSPGERLPGLVDAALRHFGAKGFRGTQMAEIAAELGVSEAALYRYVASKETLFDLVVRRALLLDDLPEGPFPLPAVTLEQTMAVITSRLVSPGTFGALADALARDLAEDPIAELRQLLEELFSLQRLVGPAMDMIERSAREMPELKGLVDVQLRRPLVEALAEYLRRRAATDQLRTTPDAAVSARLVIETISWFARHRFRDPDGAAITDAAACEAVVDMLVHGLTRSRALPTEGPAQ